MIAKVKRTSTIKQLTSDEQCSTLTDEYESEKKKMELAIAHAEDSEYCELRDKDRRLCFLRIISCCFSSIILIVVCILIYAFKIENPFLMSIIFLLIIYMLLVEKASSRNHMAFLDCKYRLYQKVYKNKFATGELERNINGKNL